MSPIKFLNSSSDHDCFALFDKLGPFSLWESTIWSQLCTVETLCLFRKQSWSLECVIAQRLMRNTVYNWFLWDRAFSQPTGWFQKKLDTSWCDYNIDNPIACIRKRAISCQILPVCCCRFLAPFFSAHLQTCRPVQQKLQMSAPSSYL